MVTSAREVLDFWFDPATEPAWFRATPAFDARLRDAFGATVEAAAAGRLEDWARTPDGWLALLVTLDQFPRNLFRGTAQAFATDAAARHHALRGIADGLDRALPALRRVFAYLPLEHAEDRQLQQQSVMLFERLAAAAAPAERARFDGFLDYARRHRDVIERFGRFPHRNAALGRASTAEEQRYLATPGAGF